MARSNPGVFLPRANQVIKIRVLGGLGIDFQSARESFDDDRIETLGFTLGALPNGSINRFGNRPDRVSNAQDAGFLFEKCSQTRGGPHYTPTSVVLNLNMTPSPRDEDMSVRDVWTDDAALARIQIDSAPKPTI